jgi:hypothetical protein
MAVVIGSTPFQDAEQGAFRTEELETTGMEFGALRDVDLDPMSDEDDYDYD